MFPARLEIPLLWFSGDSTKADALFENKEREAELGASGTASTQTHTPAARSEPYSAVVVARENSCLTHAMNNIPPQDTYFLIKLNS